MSDEAPRGPGGFDTRVANIARMNDYFLGGKDNFAADREAADRLLAMAPEIKDMAVENRRFLGRAVRYLCAQGVRQFIDVSAGLPTRDNTHEVARSQDPGSVTVYVENDPVVLSHARAVLVDSVTSSVVEGDILHPREFLDRCRDDGLIDFDRTVAVIILGALQFIPHSDGPFESVALLRDMLPSGSHLALSHAVFDNRPEAVTPVEDVYRALLNRPGENAARTLDDVRLFFDGFELAEPGLVPLQRWRPDRPVDTAPPKGIWMAGGVGRKP
jgi:hypothetical protein